jgi:hypothetical protein
MSRILMGHQIEQMGTYIGTIGKKLLYLILWNIKLELRRMEKNIWITELEQMDIL